MPYIARTNGGQEVLELREGHLSSVPEDDRGNWRNVSKVYSTVDGVATERGPLKITVNGDGSQVTMVWPAVAVPAPLVKLRLKQRAADKAWQVEVGGITVNGLRVPTDDRAKLLIQGAAATTPAEAETEFVIGTMRVTMTGAQLATIWTAVVAHVAACFAARSAIYDAIDAGEVASLADIEDWPWP